MSNNFLASSKTQKVLLIIVCVLAFLIAAGTILAFATGSAHLGHSLRHADPQPEQIGTLKNLNEPKSPANKAFTDLGTLRSVTREDETVKNGSPSCAVVITPWLAYPEGDGAFLEELQTKTRSLRSVITGYFPRYTQKELLKKGEDAVKAELLSALNENLVMGKISAIYFSDYIFLD